MLAFSHAAAPLHTAAEAIFGQGPEAEAYSERWRTTLRDAEEGGRSGDALCSPAATGPPWRPVPSGRSTQNSGTSASMPP